MSEVLLSPAVTTLTSPAAMADTEDDDNEMRVPCSGELKQVDVEPDLHCCSVGMREERDDSEEPVRQSSEQDNAKEQHTACARDNGLEPVE